MPPDSGTDVVSELERVVGTMEEVAGHLDGLANDGIIWRGDLEEADKNRFAWALRTNARTLRDLAREISRSKETG